MSIGGHSVSARAGLEGKPDTVGDLADSPAPEPSLRNGQFGGCPPQGTHPRASLQSGFKSPLYRRQLQDPGHLVSSPANSDELVCILRLKLPGTGGAFNSQHSGFPSLQGTTEIQQIHRQARLFLEQQNTRCYYSQDAFFTGA